MGMFDYVSVNVPLPADLIIAEKSGFQTKRFNCSLQTVTISEDGRLIVPEFGVVSPLVFTFNFYGLVIDPTTHREFFQEFEAFFHSGRLAKILQVSWDMDSSSPNVIREREYTWEAVEAQQHVVELLDQQLITLGKLSHSLNLQTAFHDLEELSKVQEFLQTLQAAMSLAPTNNETDLFFSEIKRILSQSSTKVTT